MKAWHFTDGWRLRDGQSLVVGKEYVFDGEPVMCECGYHASKHVYDALQYAPGAVLSLVEVSEVTDRQDDKLVCKRRKVLATIDVEDLLREFARKCALDVIRLWDAPEIVVRYLNTGDETIRDAASTAAWDAAWAAASTAARAAARAAASTAAWDAASTAARAAAIKKQRARLARMVNQAFKEATNE